MKNLLSRFHLVTAITVVLLLSGCGPQHPYSDAYTRIEPHKLELTGAYRGDSARLLLVSDGSFIATGIPASRGEIRTQPVKGKWALRAQHLDKVADEASGTLWSLEFSDAIPLNAPETGKGATADTFPQRASLIENKPPYKILFEYDAEGDYVLELERE